MLSVLERAALLFVWKLSGSHLVVPALTACTSVVSFCSCCILFFTDALVTAVLVFLLACELWAPALTTQGDVIALRFLLFLSYTYGVALLLTTPAVTIEILTKTVCRRLQRTNGPSLDCDGRQSCKGETTITVEEEEKKKEAEEEDVKHLDSDMMFTLVAYFCCLSAWVTAALIIWHQWGPHEQCAKACLSQTNSLIRCLPSMLSPMPNIVYASQALACISLVLLFVETSRMLFWSDIKFKLNSCCLGLLTAHMAPPLPEERKLLASDPARCVDPEKTEGSCAVHKTCTWNPVQMLGDHQGHLVLISAESAKSSGGGGQELKSSTTRCGYLFSERHCESQTSGWFRCVWLLLNIVGGLVTVLAAFILPMTVSVNIMLIRSIEVLLEWIITSAVACVATVRYRATSRSEVFV